MRQESLTDVDCATARSGGGRLARRRVVGQGLGGFSLFRRCAAGNQPVCDEQSTDGEDEEEVRVEHGDAKQCTPWARWG